MQAKPSNIPSTWTSTDLLVSAEQLCILSTHFRTTSGDESSSREDGRESDELEHC